MRRLNPDLHLPMFGEGVVTGVAVTVGALGGEAGGNGDVTATHRLGIGQDKQRIGSGRITGGHLYILNTPGTAQCTSWRRAKRSGKSASEVMARKATRGRRCSTPGIGSTFQTNLARPLCSSRAKFEKLAANPLNDGLTNSSLAPSDGEISFAPTRTWCIGGNDGLDRHVSDWIGWHGQPAVLGGNCRPSG